MRNRGLEVLAPAIIFFAASSARAADEGAGNGLNAVLGKFGMAPLERVFSPLTGLQINANQDNSNAAVKGSFIRSGRNGTFDSFGLGVTAPISKGTNESDVLTSGTLADSTSIDLQVSRLWAKGRFNPKNPDKDADFAEICKKAEAAYMKAKNKSSFDEEKDGSCDSGFVGQWDPNDSERFLDKFWRPDSWIVALGGEGKITSRNYNYYNGSTLAKASETKRPWSVSGYFAFVPPLSSGSFLSGTFFDLKYTYGQDYKDQTTKTLCPAASASVTTCVSGPIGIPKPITTNALSFEARRAFWKIAVAPQVIYDFKSNATGVDVPFYLFSDGKSGLTGGIRAGWSSDKHRTLVGVFTTKAFGPINF